MLAMFRFALPVLAVLFLARSSAPAASLFIDIDPSYALSDSSVLSGSDRERLVRINARALIHEKSQTAKDINLNLFHDTSLLSQLHSAEHTNGMFRWRGTIGGDPAGYAVLLMEDSELSGRIYAFDREYEVIPSGNGIHRIRRQKPMEEPFDPLAVIPSGLQERVGVAAARKTTPVVQVILVYSKKAVEKTVIPARRYAQLAIDEINMILRNSKANVAVDLTGVFVLEYDELGNIFGDLERFRNPNDGVWDEVHRFRDARKADISTLVVSYQQSFGGAASQLYDLSLDFAPFAFNIVRIVLLGFHVPTLAHEIGHTLGSTHDRCENGAGIFDYSNAFENREQGWATIMSNGTCLVDAGRVSFARLPVFSNHRVKYKGLSTGTGLKARDPANNAASLFHGASLGSQWRQNCRKGSRLPALIAPQDGAQNVSAAASMQWKMRGWPWVELQISTSPSFQKRRTYIAFSKKMFIPLEDGKTYYWRIRGMNDCQESDFTDTRSFTTN